MKLYRIVMADGTCLTWSAESYAEVWIELRSYGYEPVAITELGLAA